MTRYPILGSVMSVSGDASYRNELFQERSKMYDLAKAIQEDRRHQADMYRVVSNLPKEHSMSVGRYRLTVSKRASGPTLPAASRSFS